MKRSGSFAFSQPVVAAGGKRQRRFQQRRRQKISQIPLLREIKQRTIALQSAGTSTANPTVDLMNGIAEGDDIDARNGRQIQMLQYEAQVFVSRNTAVSNPDSQVVRVVVVFDKIGEGVNPAWTDLFTENTSFGHYNRDNVPSRFLVLKDVAIPVAGVTTDPVGPFTVLQPEPKVVRLKGSLGGKLAQYNGAGGAVAQIIKGGLYLMFNGSGGTANSHAVAWSTITKYYDT